MRLSKPPLSIKDNSLPRTTRNRFNINHLEAIKFSRFQYGLESGSGPGGRRFKSSLPDHLFSVTYADSEVLKNPTVGKNVTLFTSQVFPWAIRCPPPTEIPAATPSKGMREPAVKFIRRISKGILIFKALTLDQHIGVQIPGGS